uniref:ZP domain-containing protein n=1 Tax=Parastrongyloides trichosuri TaxID=131310 RepID=A0A0N4Z9C2_PARTI
MCSPNGITASISFERPFEGKIYSLNYANTHECIYYNGETFYDNILLFTIPVTKCGTRITKNTRDIVDSMENRIYVQMNRNTQTIYDHQYSFVCELALDPKVTEPGSIDAFKNLDMDSDGIPKPELLLNYRNLQFPLPHKEPLLPAPIKPIIVDYLSKGIDTSNKGIEKSIDDVDGKMATNKYSYIDRLEKFAFQNKIDDTRRIKNGVLINIPSSQVKEHTSTKTDTTEKSIIYSTTTKEDEIEVSTGRDKIDLPYTKLVATQEVNKTEEKNKREIILEIQKGEGPYGNTVNKPLRIGEILTLVVKCKGSKSKNHYNMFVHSCYASDGDKKNEVELIDKSGCPVNSQIIGKFERTKNAYDEELYYFKMKTFKFPGIDNVFFYCAVDISEDKHFPEVCPNGTEKIKRLRRTLNENHNHTIVVYDNIKVEVEDNYDTVKGDTLKLNNQSETLELFFKRPYIFYPLVILVLLILLSFFIFLIYFYRNRNRNKRSSVTPRTISSVITKVPSQQLFQEANTNPLPVFSFDKVGKRKMSIFTEA